MAKKVYKIEAFEGGINKRNDPRDINDNQLEEAFNVDISNPGRITMPGDALSEYNTTNVKGVSAAIASDQRNILSNGVGITPGYGLFVFYHDFNMKGNADGEPYPANTPDELETEFICINDGADIHIWDSCHNSVGDDLWIRRAITLGMVHLGNNDTKVKPVYYKADNGLRVCDGSFNTKFVTQLQTEMSTTSTGLVGDIALGDAILSYTNDLAIPYVKINSEIMKVTLPQISTNIVERGQFGTVAQKHLVDSDIFYVNVPKILTHINRPLLEESGANTSINRWVEDIQYPEPPLDSAFSIFQDASIIAQSGSTLLSDTIYPASPGNVFMGIAEASDADDIYTISDSVVPSTESGNTGETIVNIPLEQNGVAINVAGQGFSIGKFLIITGIVGDGAVLNGTQEIVGFADGGVVKIANEAPVSYTAANYIEARVQLEDEIISDDLKNQYIFGMSYLYDGGSNVLQESNVQTGYLHSPLISQSESVFKTITNWDTSPTSFSQTALTTSDNNGFQHINGIVTAINANNEFLAYDDGTSAITAEAYYYVSITVLDPIGGTADGVLTISVGQSLNSSSNLAIDFSSVNAGTYTKKIQAPASGSLDATLIFSLKATTNASCRISNVQVWSSTGDKMSSSKTIDFRTFTNAAKATCTFLCNDSRSGTNQNNSWNERIEGFRIYMKQVDMIGGGLSEEWLLFYNVNIKDGTYIAHAKDGDIETLRLGDISGSTWDATNTTDARAVVTSNLAGDSIKNIPLFTYESENGYSAETNLAAMYKTAAIIERKVYIGNVKIGERTYPDRMIRAASDKFDAFPDDVFHYIDIATADGDSIVKLESIGNKLIQFKKKNAYLIEVSLEGEDVLETWSHAGILAPSQCVKARNGVVWVNENGLFSYDGDKLSRVSMDRFTSLDWAVEEDENTPILLGYDETTDKVLVQTLGNSDKAHGGFIYDLRTDSFVESQYLFNWYVATFQPALDDIHPAPVRIAAISLDGAGITIT